MITQAELKQILHYEPITGKFTWLARVANCIHIGDEAGSVFKKSTTLSYLHIQIDKKVCKAHRLAWLYMTGNYPQHGVLHDDGDGLNNRWTNLSDNTQAENALNRKLNSNNESGQSGVMWRERDQRWIAQINIDGKQTHLGQFKEKVDAITARKQAELNHNYHPNHGK